MDDLNTIIFQAGNCLRPDGVLLLEHGYDQAGKVRRALAGAGWKGVEQFQDLAGHLRVSSAVVGSAR